MIELSVIIPNYQTDENLFLACLNSITTGCENEIEIIVVDDGSQETYRENVYGKAEFQDERIKVIFKKNGGVSSARNCGLAEAKGRFIAFVDADDIIVGSFIKDSLFAAENSGAEIVVGGVVDLGKHPGIDSYLYTSPVSQGDLKIYKQRNKMIDLLLGVPSRFSDRAGYIGRGPVAKIVRSDIAKQVLFQESLTIYEDTLWNMNLLKLVNSACVVERIWYGYHNTIQSASKGFHPDEIERSTKGMNAIAEAIDLSDWTICKAYREQCIVEYLRIVNSYFLSTKKTENMISKLKDSRRLLRTVPWNTVGSLRDLKGLSVKMQVYGLLYILNAWIPIKHMLNALPSKRH